MLLNVDESYFNDGLLIANKVYLIYLESRIIFIELILCYSGLIRFYLIFIVSGLLELVIDVFLVKFFIGDPRRVIIRFWVVFLV